MTKTEYDNLKTFPIEMVSLVRYDAGNVSLKRGDSFLAVRKQTLGTDDYSVIDDSGHPHHFTGCDLLIKE